eukprot:866212-Pleurochrysis_carterae.AAC.1
MGCLPEKDLLLGGVVGAASLLVLLAAAAAAGGEGSGLYSPSSFFSVLVYPESEDGSTELFSFVLLPFLLSFRLRFRPSACADLLVSWSRQDRALPSLGLAPVRRQEVEIWLELCLQLLALRHRLEVDHSQMRLKLFLQLELWQRLVL